MQQRCATFSAGRNARNAPAADARRDDYLDFDDLKERPTVPPFKPGDLEKAEAEPILVLPSAPSGVGKFVPGAKARYEQTVEALQVEHRQKMQEYMLRENDRKAALANALAERDAEVARIEAAAAAQHEEVNQFRGQFEQGDPSAIVEYFSLVLDRSGYPAGFPKQHRMAFVPESKQLVVEYELPTFEAAVPTVKTYRYVRARDAIDQTARPAAGALGCVHRIVRTLGCEVCRFSASVAGLWPARRSESRLIGEQSPHALSERSAAS